MKNFINNNKILIISSVIVIAIIGVGLFLIFSKNSVKNDENNSSPVIQTKTGQVVINPAYHVLTPVDSKSFKKTYCQDIADSRVIELTLENSQKSAQFLRQATDKAKKEGDIETSKTLGEFAQIVADYDPNSSMSGARFISHIDKIENISQDNCNIIYLAHPTEENIEKARKLATTPFTLPSDSATKSPEDIAAEKEQQDVFRPEKGLPIGSFKVNVDPNLFTQPYCAPLADMTKKVGLGGYEQELVLRLRVGYKNILSQMNKSTVSPATKEAYNWLAKYYNLNSVLPGGPAAPTSPEYTKNFTIMREDAKNTCGITYITSN